jgi:hypothetical protein
MSRTATLIALTAVAALGLTACGKKADATAPADATAASTDAAPNAPSADAAAPATPSADATAAPADSQAATMSGGTESADQPKTGNAGPDATISNAPEKK